MIDKKDIETRADIDDLMNRFYARAMTDEKIGYIFEIAELDLEHHLPITGDFWETMLFSTGNYHRHGRNPLQIHALLDEKTPLRPEHFRRWLEIFRASVDEAFVGERADFIKLRAQMIGNRMSNFVSGIPALAR
ncbi:MAG: group III truncated hemoglobin [Acidobacteria bacterium]|nr:group III truncated hemoglobin [Acidobacteriota bacterium]